MPTLPPTPTFQRDSVISLFKVVFYLALIYMGLWLLWMMRALIPPILIAATIAVALAPEIDILERKKLPRWLAVLLIYILFVGVSIILTMVVSENVGGQIKQLGNFIAAHGQTAFSHLQSSLPSTPKSIGKFKIPEHTQLRIKDFINNVPDQITAYFSNVLLAFSAQLPEMAGNVLNAIIVPILTFYLLVDYHKIVGKILLFVRPDRRDNVLISMADVVTVFGQYVRGVVIMVLVDIAVTYAVLRVMHVQFPETVALICGVLYAVPYLGAMVSTVLIFLMAWLGLSLAKAVVILVIMVVIHQLIFDQIVAPKIIGKQVDLHPLLAFLAMLVGGTLFGVGGTLLAVPIAAATRIILVRVYPRLQEEYVGATIIDKEALTKPKRRSRKISTESAKPAPAPASDPTQPAH